ncbi:MAG: hypothetical protein L0220_01400, partial [Acidobacteria bacterium]|nr:hypothetical protein [Acidobacteriota bacterium]
KFRPERLIKTALQSLPERSIYGRRREVVRLVQKEFLGDHEVISIETDTHTFIAEGLASHNCNVWRALKYAPDDVAFYADQPTNEIELHLNHLWIVNEGRERLKQCPSDESYFDAETAGRWLWGMACWIGSHYASGDGPWTRETLALAEELGTYDIQEIKRQRPHLGDNGQGIKRQLPHLGNNGKGINRQSEGRLSEYFHQISERLRNVNVCCGSWDRVLGPSVTQADKETCAVFLDPPYAVKDRDALYTTESFDVAHDVREWCREWGSHPGLRIALCGYDTEHQELESFGWTVEAWTASGGYARANSRGMANRTRERIWYSPACVNRGLFVAQTRRK